MSLSPENITQLADDVVLACGGLCPSFKSVYPEMTADDAYSIQDIVRARRESQGDRLVGWHVGVTPHVKIRQLGVHEPSFSTLMSGSSRPENGLIETGGFVEPAVAVELGFVLRDDVGDSHCSVAEIIAATDYIVPAINVIDSSFDLDPVEGVANGGLSCCYITGGRPIAPAGIDLRSIGVVVELNGEIVANAASAAVFSHPANAIALLVRHLATRGEILPAGSLVMTGGVTETVAIAKADSIVARVQGMGTVSVRFT